jgi:hypothetical protein
MLHVALCQLSMLTVDPESIGLELDSFERQLPELLPRLLPAKDLRELYPAAEGGAPTCCPLQMLGMLLLQFRYDLSEQELYLRCWRDLGFRHALGLEAGEKPSSVRSLRRFRNRLVAARGDDFVLTATLRTNNSSTMSNCRRSIPPTPAAEARSSTHSIWWRPVLVR